MLGFDDLVKIEDIDGDLYYDDTPLPEEGKVIRRYKTLYVIDNTNNSVVMMGTSIVTGEKKALKFAKRRNGALQKIRDEIALQTILSHPNILKIDEYFKYKEYVCMVTPYAPFGCLHNYIKKQHPSGLKEKTASIIMIQMIQSIMHLHGLGYAHRDVKPGNFLLFNDNEENPRVLLNDFGFATKVTQNENINGFAGTPIIAAPEVLAKLPYGFTVDNWSLGVSLFFLLCGNYPFPSFEFSPKQCTLTICKGKLNYSLLKERKISPEAINLIKKLCRLDPKRRITLSDALDHPFLASNNKTNRCECEINQRLFDNIPDFEPGL